jgi:hypothetical protein
MKTILIRNLILLGLVVFTAALCYFLPSSKVSNEVGVVLSLPENIQGYRSQLIEMSEKEKVWLPESTRYIKRSYYPEWSEPNSFFSVNMSLIVSGGDERSLHRPEVCMDGQGWSIPHKVVRKLSSEGREIEVMDLFLQRVVDEQVIRAHYYYFWVGRGISTSSYAEMKRLNVWDNFFKNVNHRWAYPGIFLYVDPNHVNPDEDAWDRAQHVVKSALPFFHKEFGAKE